MLDRKARVLGPLLGSRAPSGASVAMAIADVAAEIEWAKARLIPPEQYAAAARAAERRLPRPAARARRPLRALRGREAPPAAGSTSTISSAGAPTRSSATPTSRPRNAGASATCSSTSSRTRHRSRSRLLRAWLGDRPDLCVVGDGAQAIYAFAGADASPLTDFAAALPRRAHDRARAQLPVAPTRSSRSPRPRSARRRASSATRPARFVRPTARADDRRLRRRRATKPR